MMNTDLTDEPRSYTLLTLGLGSLVLLAVLVVVCLPYFYIKPIKTIEITKGAAGAFMIGNSKEEVLAKLSHQLFSPEPKPEECPTTWIKVSEMSDVQRLCLLNADTWIEGVVSARSLCPPNVDVNSTLTFQSGKLTRMTVVCRRPK